MMDQNEPGRAAAVSTTRCSSRNTPDPYFPPSAVRLLLPCPLVGTFDRAEREIAAALVVRCCQVSGDWHPVPPDEVGRVIRADIDAGNEPFASISRNLFLTPDIWDLVAKGWACWTGKPGGEVEFTAQGFERLRRWVTPESQTAQGPVGR